MDRVLEIGGFAAGYCGRLFVQGGAEVVRIESAHAPLGWVSSTALDLYLHPGKRRVLTDNPALIAELASHADIVVVEGATANVIDELGFNQWHAPVKVAITPFGRTGPKRNWRAAPNVLLAMGGYTNLMGDANRAPLTLPGHYVEFQSGGFAYTVANACRLADEANAIDISMLEVVMSLSQFTTVMWHCAGNIRSRHGSDFWSVVPTNLFQCSDGWVYVNIVPTFWDAFTVFIDRPELLVDERFTTNDLRMKNRDVLHEIIAAAVASQSRAELQARAGEHRVPIGVVLTVAEVLDDPHLAERSVWQQVTGMDGQSVRSPRPAWWLHDEPQPDLKLTPVEVVRGGN